MQGATTLLLIVQRNVRVRVQSILNVGSQPIDLLFPLFSPGIESTIKKSQDTDSPIPDTKQSRLELVEDYTLHPRGNPDFVGKSYFSEDELAVWAEAVREYSRVGFPFTEADLRGMLQAGVRDSLQMDVEAGRINSFVDTPRAEGGDIPEFGARFMTG